jgi:hypothetical protein
MKVQKILVTTVFASVFALSACSSSVGFVVLDKQTNEDIKDYKVHVKGHGVDKDLTPGEKVKLKNGFFAPPRYKADIEAEGYSKTTDHQLQRKFCFFCFKSFGTAGKQTVYLNREDSSSMSAEPATSAEPEETN